tara:strand:+ start:645 stop:851 length:207 start_codon:yes stop_codon:yes gene_type:complete
MSKVIFCNDDYYWKKFEEMLPDLVESFSVEAIMEAVDIEKEIQTEKLLDQQELAEGRKPEDYGVPRGS